MLPVAPRSEADERKVQWTFRRPNGARAYKSTRQVALFQDQLESAAPRIRAPARLDRQADSRRQSFGRHFRLFGKARGVALLLKRKLQDQLAPGLALAMTGEGLVMLHDTEPEADIAMAGAPGRLTFHAPDQRHTLELDDSRQVALARRGQRSPDSIIAAAAVAAAGKSAQAWNGWGLPPGPSWDAPLSKSLRAAPAPGWAPAPRQSTIRCRRR